MAAVVASCRKALIGTGGPFVCFSGTSAAFCLEEHSRVGGPQLLNAQ